MTQESAQATSERGPAVADGLRDGPDRPTPLHLPWLLDLWIPPAYTEFIGAQLMDVVRRGCNDLSVTEEEGVR